MLGPIVRRRPSCGRTSGKSRFGRSVAVYGDTVVVGEPEADVKKGRVYVFTKPADIGVWNDIASKDQC